MNKTAQFWNTLSSRYDEQVIKKYSEAYRKTIEKTKTHLRNSDTVLDFACGTGITTVELAKDVKEICAIDISKDMIEIAVEKIQTENIQNVNFEVCDIMDDRIKENSFDVVLAFNVLYFIKDIDTTLNRVSRLLKPGGLFLSVTDCLGVKKSISSIFQSILGRIGIIPYMRKYGMNELENVIKKAGFTIIDSENLYTDPPNYYLAAKKDN